MLRMYELIDWMEKLRDKLLAKSKNKATPLTPPEKNAFEVLNENNYMFDMTAGRDSNRIEAVYKEVQDALNGKPRAAKQAPPPKPPKDPIAYIYDRRDEIIARSGGDAEKLKAELKNELAKYQVDPAAMLASFKLTSRLTEPLKSIIREEYNNEVKAFFAERTEREKLTAKDTRDNLTQNEKYQDYHHLVKQLRHIDKAIKLDAQMQYGHAEGEKGLKALREQVYTRIQMVYYNKVPKPDPAPQPEQQRQSTSPPQREMTLREAEKKLQEAKRFFPDDVENAQKLVDKLKSREPVTKVQPQAQQQQPAAQPPAQPPLPPGSISLREAEKELRDAQKFFPTDVKNAQNLVDRIKGGEIIMREQWRREQEREHHKNIKLAAPPPTKTVPVPPKTKPLPQKPGEESVNKDEQTSPRKKM